MPAKERKDVTIEKCVKLYKEHKNMTIVGEILKCDSNLVRKRLIEAGVDTTLGSNPENKRDLKNKNTKKPRVKFNTKREQAHYICTVLREPLTDLIIECMGANYSGRGYDFIKEDSNGL